MTNTILCAECGSTNVKQIKQFHTEVYVRTENAIGTARVGLAQCRNCKNVFAMNLDQ
jgi:NMD protein affecting ribosome stability and mRNA decay